MRSDLLKLAATVQICEGADEGRWAEHQGRSNGQHIRAHGRQQQHRYTCVDSVSGLMMAPGFGCLPEALDPPFAKRGVLHL